MSKHKVIEKARKLDELNKKIKHLTAKADKYKASIKSIMEEEGVTAIEDDGVRISYVQTERTNYDLDVLVEHLPAKVVKRITKTVLDPGALQGEVLAGNIDPDVVARSSSLSLSAPYLKVTVKDD